MELILSIIIYCISLFVILKYVKKECLEIFLLIILTVICKLIIGKNGAFYPIYALPILLSLRHKKVYSLAYTLVMLLIINMFYGFGSWTILQLVLYGTISLLSFKIRNFLNNKNYVNLIAYNFIIIFLYGVFMDIGTFYFGNFLGYNNVFTAVAMGIPFDLKFGYGGAIYGGITLAIGYLVSMKELFVFKGLTLVKEIKQVSY